MKFHPLLCAVVVASMLAACGGGSQDVAVTPPAITPPVIPPIIPPVAPPVEPPVVTPPPIDLNGDWMVLANHCETPRASQDVQGTLTDEKKWLLSFFDASYLWYREIPANLNMADYKTAIDYFAVLKTTAITESGRLKDRFHFTYPTTVWEALSNAGVELGYGLTWVRSTDASKPRVWSATMVEPGSPAAVAGLQRGDTLLSVDGVQVGDTSAAMAPTTEGESHQLTLSRNGAMLSVSLTAAKVSKAPVKNAKVIETPTGKVGYLQFNEHNAVSEKQLVNAIDGFKTAGINDLVLDMRYNGGGLLTVASELAYMIAGPEATTGKIFEKPLYNDKTAPQAALKFQAKAAGYPSPAPIKAGTVLPYLGLKRVTMLTTPGTCSASESVINSLRGVGVEVNLIGGETCGKPYAFTPANNCGTTYFAIQFQGTNNQGFGDYADGFQPTCNVADDLTHALGDPAERVLAAALSYRANGVCPMTPLANRSQTGAGAMRLVRPEIQEISIRDR